jgi:Dolichyl-phosphate-mannose-protein mannosyltransferase
MNRRRKLEPLLFALGVALSRFVFRSPVLYDLDSVNFALAIEHFDPRVHQPHPPGYFLYICLARAINHIVHDPNLALVILSIAASCGTIVYIYKLGLTWFGLNEARFAGALFLLSPSAWFHGTVALTYSLEAFFSAAMGYLCWGVGCGNTRWILPAGLFLGISAGIRPSSILFLGPLYLYSLRKAPLGRKLSGIGVLLLTLVAWFLPMIAASGGLDAYLRSLISLWHLVPSRNTVFNSSPATSVARFCFLILIGLINFGAASFALITAARRKIPVDTEKKRFTLVWTVPALSFFTFIFLQFVNSGYLLLLSAPACIWLGLWISDWYRQSRLAKPYRLAIVAFGAATNIAVFLVSPFYCSYRSVQQFNGELEGVRSALPKVGAANDVLIVGFDSHFLGYRHAGYYLPDYLTVEYPEVELDEGTRIFAMHDRNTRLVRELPAAPYRRFVLFPLPDGDPAYSAYMAKVKGLLSSQDLQTIRIGGKDYVTAPIASLPLLFPHTAKAMKRDVYPPRHFRVGCCKQP